MVPAYLGKSQPVSGVGNLAGGTLSEGPTAPGAPERAIVHPAMK
jgi:hypothetical protein